LCRCWQNDVRVLGCVGQELLVNDGEQILTFQPRSGGFGVGNDDKWIAVPHDEGMNARPTALSGSRRRQDFSESTHVECAWFGSTLYVFEVEAHEGGINEVLAVGADTLGNSAAAFSPGPGECR